MVRSKDFDLVVLMTNPDPVELAIARDQLEKSGIKSHVQNQSARGAYGTGPFRLRYMPDPQLVVMRKDARQAGEVLGIPVSPEVDAPPRQRQPGFKGWIRWIAGLD